MSINNQPSLFLVFSNAKSDCLGYKTDLSSGCYTFHLWNNCFRFSKQISDAGVCLSSLSNNIRGTLHIIGEISWVK